MHCLNSDKKAEDTYYQANNWASYDDWRRARDIEITQRDRPDADGLHSVPARQLTAGGHDRVTVEGAAHTVSIRPYIQTLTTDTAPIAPTG